MLNLFSGHNYAKSIADGSNLSSMIAPGISYSLDKPLGYSMFVDVMPQQPPATSQMTDFDYDQIMKLLPRFFGNMGGQGRQSDFFTMPSVFSDIY